MAGTSRNKLFALPFLSLLIYAIAGTLVGPAIDYLSTFSLALYGLQIAFLSSAVFIGISISSLVAGRIADRYGFCRMLPVASAFLALAMVVLYFASDFLSYSAGFILIGVCGGIIQSSANPLVSQLFPEKKGAALSTLHIAWSLGAFTGPTLAGLFFARRMFREPFLLVILLSILFLLFTQFFRTRLRGLQAEKHESEPKSEEKKVRQKTFSMKLVVLILIVFFYWGSEQSINMWLVVYLHVGAFFDIFLSSMTLALFWASMGIGRIVLGPFADRVGMRKMMLSLGIIGSAALLLNYASTGYALVADWCIIGFIYSVIFPGIMALAYEAFPESAGTAIGALHTFGVFGGIIMPAAIGVLVMLTGAGAAITVITANLMLMCVFVYILGVNRAK